MPSPVVAVVGRMAIPTGGGFSGPRFNGLALVKLLLLLFEGLGVFPEEILLIGRTVTGLAATIVVDTGCVF